MTTNEQALPDGLAADIDTMRDVYMLPSQRAAHERIAALATRAAAEDGVAVVYRHWDVERGRWHYHEEEPTDVCEALYAHPAATPSEPPAAEDGEASQEAVAAICKKWLLREETVRDILSMATTPSEPTAPYREGCWVGTITGEHGGAIDWRGGVLALYRDFQPGTKLYAHTAPEPTASGAVVTREDVEALVAGPYMYHHKMNELQEREAKGFDRCRELTLKNIEIFFTARCAMSAAVAAGAGEKGRG